MAERSLLFLYDGTSIVWISNISWVLGCFVFPSVASMKTATATRLSTNLDDGAKEARHGIFSY